MSIQSPPADLLRALVAATSGVVGAGFLRALVRHVAEELGARGAAISEIDDDGCQRALAVWPLGGELFEGGELRQGGGDLWLPIPGGDARPVGALLVRGAPPVDEEHLAVLRAFAARAAAEVDRRRHDATLRAREAEVAESRARVLEAADEERRRIGRDLHDGAQQRLIAVTQAIDLARRALPPGSQAADAHLARARDQAVQAGAELRELARGLHPVGLGQRGLAVALRSLAAACPVPVEIESLPDRRLPMAIELTAYYLVSEALTNAARHADATRATVLVEQTGRMVHVVVADDGVGGADEGRGTGLTGLTDRVAALGGTFEVTSRRGEGTTLRADIPVAPIRDAREPYLEFGHPDDGGDGERAIQAVLDGRKTGSLSLAREWELEGGPPRIGQRLPLRDHTGAHRATVEITRVSVMPFGNIDAETLATTGDDDARDVESWRAARRAFWDACRHDIAVVLGEPGWRLTDEEPVVALRFRVAG